MMKIRLFILSLSVLAVAASAVLRMQLRHEHKDTFLKQNATTGDL